MNGSLWMNLNMIWEPNLNVETKAQGAAATVTLLTGHSLMTLTTEVRNYQPHKKRAMTNIVQQPIHKQL